MLHPLLILTRCNSKCSTDRSWRLKSTGVGKGRVHLQNETDCFILLSRGKILYSLRAARAAAPGSDLLRKREARP